MILTHQKINSTSLVGPKTKNLKTLKESGFEVPNFIAIPSDKIHATLNTEGKTMINKVVQALPSTKYAIRSSALIEDSKSQSFAGQFQTKVNVSAQEIPLAIKEICEQAKQLLKGDLSKFSIIIQEYISADFSGVTFTRNPNSKREMIVEYHRGIGEEIVEGKVTPKQIRINWNQKPKKTQIPNFQTIRNEFEKIENLFSFPQDIEWCIKKNKLHILQSRPITTISSDEYKSFLFLDNELPKNKKFYFKKTEISEIAPRPTPFTLSILKSLYKQEGPISKVYAKHKIQYQYQDFFIIIKNQLFVDREKEIKTLFPAYSYLSNNNFQPKPHTTKGLWKTLKNSFYLARIKLSKINNLETNLEQLLQKSLDNTNLEQSIKQFQESYQVIFEINLLAQKALQNLKQITTKESITTLQAITAKVSPNQISQLKTNLPENLTGNSLEISDSTPFTKKAPSLEPNNQVTQWIESKPQWKQEFLIQTITSAQKFNALREYGRWLTVKHINNIRSQIINIAKQNNFQESKSIFFHTVEEIIDNQLDEQLCKQRQTEHSKYTDTKLPSSLTSNPIEGEQKTEGVSPGTAVGKIATTSTSNLKGKILYTQTLEPSLTKHFHQISGIISAEGGLLSHLSIIAREEKIPVIVHCDLQKLQIQEGDTISINGDTGSITKLNPLS